MGKCRQEIILFSGNMEPHNRKEVKRQDQHGCRLYPAVFKLKTVAKGGIEYGLHILSKSGFHRNESFRGIYVHYS